MGVIICKRHGRNGITHTCKHIKEAFKANIDIKIKQLQVLKTQVCLECWDTYNLENIAHYENDNIINLSEEELDKIESYHKKIPEEILCYGCYKEWRKNLENDYF